SSPRSDLRLTVMDFLLALNNRKYQESWFGLWLGPDCRPNKERPASPPCGFSTLTTSAPSQASASVQDGPASNWVRSRTRTPARKAGNPLFVAIFSSSPLSGIGCARWWMSWTLIGAFGIRSNQLPTIFNQCAMAEAGGLTSYGPSFPGLFRRAAEFVDKILREAKPADIPVGQPTEFELVVNIKTATALGLTVPLTLQAIADEVIE